MIQISQTVPSPVLAPCSAAQLEPAVNSGPQPARPGRGSCPPRQRRGPRGMGEGPQQFHHPDQAQCEPHRAIRSFSTLSRGTRLNSLSPYYWKILFTKQHLSDVLFLKRIHWCFDEGPSTCSLQKTWITQTAQRRKLKSTLA